MVNRPPRPALLGAVHRHVGVLQQVVARGALVAQGDADADGGHHFVPGPQRDRVAQRPEDGRRHLAGLVGRRDALQQDDELVTSVARERVAGPHRPAQALGDDAQELVTQLMPEVVVDHLEAVDVAEEHGHRAAGPVGLQQRVVEMVEEEAAVGQAGQRVLERVASQLLLEGLAFGGVAEHYDRSRRGRAPHDGRGGHGDREVRPVQALEERVVARDVAAQRNGPQGGLAQEVRRLRRRDDGALVGPPAGRTSRACRCPPGS